MHKLKYRILIICLVLGLAACGNLSSDVSGSASDALSQETTQYATGYSLKHISLEIVFPEKVEAYPFNNNTPYMYEHNGVAPRGLRDRFEEHYPSLVADQINFDGGWSMAEFRWDQLEGVRLMMSVMFLQAFKKSDIDGGMKVQYGSFTRNDLCIELPKEELMKYLWKETDDYYIIDFSDFYINDYRVFACEAALFNLDTGEYLDLNEKKLDFNTFLGKVNDVRTELKSKITLAKTES